MLRIGVDIGGVLSKYPHELRFLLDRLCHDVELFVITDMHNKDEVIKTLRNNSFDSFIFSDSNIYCADYQKHGEFCKAVIIKEVGINIFIDDFPGYLNWDSKFGPAPMRLMVQPDPFKPYWHEDWKVEIESDFGRRKYYG